MNVPPEKRVRRAGRPKVKAGCVNCKSRRVRCDETRPECQKCVNTGRMCGGFPAHRNSAHVSIPNCAPTILDQCVVQEFVSSFLTRSEIFRLFSASSMIYRNLFRVQMEVQLQSNAVLAESTSSNDIAHTPLSIYRLSTIELTIELDIVRTFDFPCPACKFGYCDAKLACTFGPGSYNFIDFLVAKMEMLYSHIRHWHRRGLPFHSNNPGVMASFSARRGYEDHQNQLETFERTLEIVLNLSPPGLIGSTCSSIVLWVDDYTGSQHRMFYAAHKSKPEPSRPEVASMETLRQGNSSSLTETNIQEPNGPIFGNEALCSSQRSIGPTSSSHSRIGSSRRFVQPSRKSKKHRISNAGLPLKISNDFSTTLSPPAIATNTTCLSISSNVVDDYCDDEHDEDLSLFLDRENLNQFDELDPPFSFDIGVPYAITDEDFSDNITWMEDPAVPVLDIVLYDHAKHGGSNAKLAQQDSAFTLHKLLEKMSIRKMAKYSKRGVRADLPTTSLGNRPFSTPGPNDLSKVLLETVLDEPVTAASSRFFSPRPLPHGTVRLKWTCRCGHKAFDDFQELERDSIFILAAELIDAGYVLHAHVSNQADGPFTTLMMKLNNAFVGARKRIYRPKSTTLPLFSASGLANSIALQCLPTRKCRWLHLCLKKRPYATKLEPLHVCKDEQKNDYTDDTFFQALRKAYYTQRTWKEKVLFKLEKIEFVEFELCPEDLVDHIIPDKLPPSIDEYDFLPPPPLKKCPPIGAEHMMHLFTSCSAQPQSTSLYLRHIPKRKDKALSFRADLIEGNTGWGLHFVEKSNGSLPMTVLFAVSLIVGIVFAVCWSYWKEDVQGAFGVASYVTSVVTLAVMTWQMRSV
ncbi:hypothetical protein DL98DRAFT_651555 [Cadophora sp. DSE1049]|nr:hypothetical protein DL98DRAFT_651555 [Cadophora sp. DSE1049]